MKSRAKKIYHNKFLFLCSIIFIILFIYLYTFHLIYSLSENYFDERSDQISESGISQLSSSTNSLSDSINSVVEDAERLIRTIAVNSTVNNLVTALENSDPDVNAVTIGSGFARNFLTSEATRSRLFASGLSDEIRADIAVTAAGGGIMILDGEGRRLVASSGAPTPTDAVRRQDQAVELLTIDGMTYLGVTAPIPGDRPDTLTETGTVNADGHGTAGTVLGLAPLNRLLAEIRHTDTSIAGGGMTRHIVQSHEASVLILTGNHLGSERLSTDHGAGRTLLQALNTPGTPQRGLSADGFPTIGLAAATDIPTLYAVSELNLASREHSVWQARIASRTAIVLAGLLALLAAAYAARLATGRQPTTGNTLKTGALFEEKHENLLMKSILHAIDDEIVVRDKNDNVIFRNKSAPASGASAASTAAETGDSDLDYVRPFLPEIEGASGSITIKRSLSADPGSPLGTTGVIQTATVENALYAIVGELDKRDSHSADHSHRVATIAGRIARRLDFDDATTRRIELAGRLLNIGKLRISRDLLIDNTPFDEKTKETVRREIASVADILRSNGGEDPFIDMLEQAFERLDGSGFPNGLRGDAIGLPARILAAANTYVALVSSRPHRLPISPTDALIVMRRDTPHRLDPSVIDALEADVVSVHT